LIVHIDTVPGKRGMNIARERADGLAKINRERDGGTIAVPV